MSRPSFPSVAKHDAVTCFHCRQPLTGEPLDSGYPPRYGAFKQRCGDCQLWTFYDVVCSHNAMVERVGDPLHAWQCADCGYLYGKD
jgi:hypothetical protein